jgi:hypothetical protein
MWLVDVDHVPPRSWYDLLGIFAAGLHEDRYVKDKKVNRQIHKRQVQDFERYHNARVIQAEMH